MLSDKEKELLSTSYTNNEKLVEIENKLRYLVEKRDDLERYFNKRDYKLVWFTTIFNLILASSIGTTVIKLGLNLDKEVYEYFTLMIALFWVAFGAIEYNIEKNSTKKEESIIEKKYNVTKENKQELKNTDKRIRNLERMKTKITDDERYIARQLEKLKVLEIKK